MAKYSKQLHIRKNGVVTNIDLFTATTDITSGQYIGLRDGATKVYAPYGSTSDSLATNLRIRKNGSMYSILNTIRAAAGSFIFAASGQRNNGYSSNTTFTVPAGWTTIYVSACGAGGGSYNSAINNVKFGGCGAYCVQYPLAVTPGQVISITVGAGGRAGAVNSAAAASSGGFVGAATAGGDTIVGSLTLKGGGAANGSSVGAGGTITFSGSNAGMAGISDCSGDPQIIGSLGYTDHFGVWHWGGFGCAGSMGYESYGYQGLVVIEWF